jgi:hypothetical protein
MEGTSFYSVKGGAGCTTIASAHAMLQAQAGTCRVSLRSKQPNDIAGIFGAFPLDDHDHAVELLPMLDYEPWDMEPPRVFGKMVVRDYGLNPDPDDVPEARLFCVLRPCYLHLRHYLASPVKANGIVLVNEPGRSLTRRDVEDVTGVPVVHEVTIDPAVARAIDAGIFGARLARSLQRVSF